MAEILPPSTTLATPVVITNTVTNREPKRVVIEYDIDPTKSTITFVTVGRMYDQNGAYAGDYEELSGTYPLQEMNADLFNKYVTPALAGACLERGLL